MIVVQGALLHILIHVQHSSSHALYCLKGEYLLSSGNCSPGNQYNVLVHLGQTHPQNHASGLTLVLWILEQTLIASTSSHLQVAAHRPSCTTLHLYSTPQYVCT